MSQSTFESTIDPKKGYPVTLFVYDLSGGLAKVYSQAFAQSLGKTIDGVWHTSVVVYEVEYFYGGGIQSSTPYRTPYGNPVQVINLGHTALPQSMFHDYLREVSPRFSASQYNLLKNNCNNFTDDAVQFLLGKPIPSWITGLPEEVMATPLGAMLKPMYDQFDLNLKSQLGDNYVDTEPHLPRINEKYNELLTLEEEVDKEKDKDKDKSDSNTNTETKTTSSKKEEEKNEGEHIADLLEKAISQNEHPHQQLELNTLDKELFEAKLTIDTSNANMYAKIVAKQCEVNEFQSQHLNEIVSYIEQKAKQPTKDLDLSDDALATLDELLLIAEADNAFGLMSLLRLLVLTDEMCDRYKDFLVVDQMLHKCGIPFSTDDLNSNEENKKTENSQENDADVGLGLLQFTTLGTVSHLYAKKKQRVSDNVLSMAISALDLNNCNVRLTAARVLFNASLQLKYAKFGDGKGSNDTNEHKQLNKIVGAAANRLDTETHTPTRYRLLALIGLILYCDNDIIKNNEEIKLKASKWKEKDQSVTANLLADVVKLFGNKS